MTNFNRLNKNYETSIKIDVNSLTGNFEIPNLNPQTTNITENGTYEIADTDNNPQDMEIERVDNNRVLNLNKVKDGESLRDGSISLGRFNVNVPILQRYTNLIKSDSSSYDNPTPEARDFVLIQNRKTPPENYKGVYETTNSTALISKTINSNGEYLIKDDDYYNDLGQNQGVIGWWKVNVNVPPQQVITKINAIGDDYTINPSEFTKVDHTTTSVPGNAGDLFIGFRLKDNKWTVFTELLWVTGPDNYDVGDDDAIIYYKKISTVHRGPGTYTAPNTIIYDNSNNVVAECRMMEHYDSFGGGTKRYSNLDESTDIGNSIAYTFFPEYLIPSQFKN